MPAPAEVAEAGRAWLLLLGADLALRLLPYPRATGLFLRPAASAPAEEECVRRAERAARAVDRAARRHFPWITCLRRALVLTYLLRRAGVPAELRLGVRPGRDSRPESHAWVECPHLPQEGAGYAPFRPGPVGTPG